MLTSASDLRNASKILVDGLEAEEDLPYLMPEAVVHTFYVFSAVGAAANLYLMFLIGRIAYFNYLSGHKMENVLLILLLIATCDLGILALVAPFEVQVLNYGCESSGLWIHSSGMCQFFLGSEVLLNTESVYLLVILSLTVIKDMDKQRHQDIKVPVLLSLVLASSLSIPLYVRGRTVTPRVGLMLCTVMDQWFIAREVFLIFRVLIPGFLLLSASVFVSVKMCDLKQGTFVYPRLLVLLSSLYCLLSLHRSVFTLLYLVLPRKLHEGPDAFRSPPLANVSNSHLATLIFSMIHYSVSALRPAVVLFTLKDSWNWTHSAVNKTDNGSQMKVVSYNSEETLL